MRFGSVCSGIEAASVAWHPLGWEAAWLSEIEPFPCAVLKHHYPDVPNLGDMTKFKEWQIESNVDVLVGGTPCQSFSVAGLRKGLDDPRGNLMLTYLAIAKQHRPRWLVWENVPGVLSSADGRDFGSFLGGLAICGYGFAYRVLDAQYFGVAQRRKRVFVVGYLGDWRPAAAVLFERHSLQGNPAPSREKGQEVASSVRSGFDGSSWPADISSTLNASFGAKQGQENQHINADCPMFVLSPIYGGSDANVSDTVTSKWAKGSGGPSGSECGLFVAQPIVLDRAAFNQGENAQYKFRAEPSETMDCLVAKGPHAVLQPIAFHPTQDPISSTDGTTHGLGCGSSGGQASIAVAQPVHCVDMGGNKGLNGGGILKELSQPLSTNESHVIQQSMAVRRLTPKECERLQGFPDNYTDIKPKGKQTPDGPRYKALGNSMAVPVMAWIGKRIQEVENIK